MRIRGAQQLRQTERTPKDRLEHIIPGIGLFHVMWDLLSEIFSAYWGSPGCTGSLSMLSQLLNSHASKDAKKFNLADDFAFVASEVLVKSLSKGKSKEKVIELLYSQQENPKDRFVGSMVFSLLCYVEVSSQILWLSFQSKPPLPLPFSSEML